MRVKVKKFSEVLTTLVKDGEIQNSEVFSTYYLLRKKMKTKQKKEEKEK